MSSWADRYTSFKKIYGLGEGEISFVKNALNIQGTLTIMNFLALYFPDLGGMVLQFLPILLLMAFLSFFGIGYVVDKSFDMVRRSTRWDTGRNPDMQEILRKLNNIEAQISLCSTSRKCRHRQERGKTAPKGRK